MQSGTSFFNGTLFRKNLMRFWPLWAFYTLIWTLMMPVRVMAVGPYITENGFDAPAAVLQSEGAAYMADMAYSMLSFGVFLAFGFAILAVMANFSYLFQSRSAAMFHSLPLRRENLFITSYLSGLSMLLLPNLAICLLTLFAAFCVGLWAPVAILSLFACVSAACVFFYSFGVFCAMFTGNILALPAFYLIFNFLAMYLAGIMDALCQMMLWGYSGFNLVQHPSVEWLTPLMNMMENSGYSYGGTEGYHLHDPSRFPIYALVGVALTLVSLAVYRNRHVETAGDVVTVKGMYPVFRFCVAVCGGLAFGLVTYSVLEWDGELLLVVLCLLWCGFAYFVSEMLLQKTFRVFKKWKGSLIAVAVMAAFFGVLYFDLTGYETHLPAKDQVAYAWVNGLSRNYTNIFYDAELGDPELLEQMMALHSQAALQGGEDYDSGDESAYFSVDYTLKNGEQESRRYYGIVLNKADRDVPGTFTYLAQQLILQKSASEFFAADFPVNRLTDVYLQTLWNEGQNGFSAAASQNQQQIQALREAVMQDYLAGNLGGEYLFWDDEKEAGVYATTIEFEWYEMREDSGRDWHGETFHLDEGAVNTLALLREYGMISDNCYPITAEDMQRLEQEAYESHGDPWGNYYMAEYF